MPDYVGITLFVEDAHGNVTQQTRSLDHVRSDWRGGECIGGTSGWGCVRGYERLLPPQEVPVVSVEREGLGNETYRFTGTGSSPDGRIADRRWEVTRTPFGVARAPGPPGIYRSESYEVRPELCETVDVALVHVYDRGQEGVARERVVRADTRTCTGGGPAI